jgi:hypothetical protein
MSEDVEKSDSKVLEKLAVFEVAVEIHELFLPVFNSCAFHGNV